MGDYVPINRRNNCVYVTLGTCYSVWMTVWCAHRITVHKSTKCYINTVVSPDDGHTVTRNMYRLINVRRVICVSYVYLLYLMCICCTVCVYVAFYVYLLYCVCICCILCVFVVLLCVFVVPYVYLLYYVCIDILTLHARLLAKSQYPEGPATGHLDAGFSWFPCVYKQMLRWFPSFQVATTCLSCSPPDLNFLVTFFSYLCTCKITTATG